jgi:hypothetical protein
MGVDMGGVPWSVGKNCLYTTGADLTTRLGTVVNMFYGQDENEEDFVVFQVLNRPITGKHGHFCTYSQDSPGMDMIDSTKMSWKCKLLGVAVALPYASCTPKEQVQFY